MTVDGLHWQLEPWYPGEADFRANPSTVRLQAMMRVLAQWHAAARSFRPLPAEADWFYTERGTPPGLYRRLLQIERWRTLLAPAELQRVPAELRHQFPELLELADLISRQAQPMVQWLKTFGQVKVPLQPCLRDLWYAHVLLEGDEVTGLIDPGACCSDHVATDLTRLLGSCVEEDRAAWQIGLDTYHSVLPLTANEWRLIPVYDASNVLLSGLTWWEWLVVDRKEYRDPGPVRERLQQLRRRLPVQLPDQPATRG